MQRGKTLVWHADYVVFYQRSAGEGKSKSVYRIKHELVDSINERFITDLRLTQHKRRLSALPCFVEATELIPHREKSAMKSGGLQLSCKNRSRRLFQFIFSFAKFASHISYAGGSVFNGNSLIICHSSKMELNFPACIFNLSISPR